MTQHDLSFKNGINPDDIYKEDLGVLHNIRRGMTILDSDEKVWFGRRGLPKFFDLNLEDEKSIEYTETLERAFKWVDSGIEIVRMVKANGENVQVSYVEEAKAWLICSKNVSLMARSRVEID